MRNAAIFVAGFYGAVFFWNFNLYNERYCMKKIILLLLASVVLGGCVSTPQERFPGFAQRGPQIMQMAILVDGLMIDDIDGSIDGVNAEKHKTIVPQLANDVIAELEKLGYKAQLAHVNSGLFITKDAELVFSKDNQSTGVVVDKPVIAAESQPWTDAATRQFLRDAMLQSQARQAEPKPAAASSAANNDELAIDRKSVV